MKRTLERELKVPEVAEREANGTSPGCVDFCIHSTFYAFLPLGSKDWPIHEFIRKFLPLIFLTKFWKLKYIPTTETTKIPQRRIPMVSSSELL